MLPDPDSKNLLILLDTPADAETTSTDDTSLTEECGNLMEAMSALTQSLQAKLSAEETPQRLPLVPHPLQSSPPAPTPGPARVDASGNFDKSELAAVSAIAGIVGARVVRNH